MSVNHIICIKQHLQHILSGKKKDVSVFIWKKKSFQMSPGVHISLLESHWLKV